MRYAVALALLSLVPVLVVLTLVARLFSGLG